MRNLKRILSLAMASIMLVGMMVVGASAADFPDSDKIKNVDAVDTMVALGIIKGTDDGTFNPEGIVTRAEMAKMICVAMNGGKDPNLGAGSKTFADTATHWAGGYIDYCVTNGYVSGDDKGNFNPNATVTGTEAAKMILLTLGYNAETEGFVNNAKWDVNINVRASSKGLYDNVAINPSEGLSRDNAAQMIYDGLQAVMVKYEMVGIVGGNGISQAVDVEPLSGKDTILKTKFNMQTAYGYMTGVKYDSKKAEYTYTVATTTVMGGDPITQPAGVSLPSSIKSAKDFSALYGQQVKVLFKNDTDKTIYGIYANDSTVLVNSIGGKLPTTVNATATSVKIDGTTYDLTKAAKDVPVYNFNDTTGSTVLSTANLSVDTAAYSIALIDNTGDGEGDVLVVYPVSVVKVTFVGKDSITAGNASYKFDDGNIYDGVKKDDYVIITDAKNTANGEFSVEKAEIVNTSVEAVRGSEVKFDGTWYTDKTGTTFAIGDSYDFVALNGYVFSAKATETSTNIDSVVFVVGFDPVAEGLGKGTQRVQFMHTDGTKETVTVAKSNKVDSTQMQAMDVSKNAVEADEIYTYTINKDKNYEIKKIDANKYDKAIGSDSDAAITVTDGKVTGGKTYTDKNALGSANTATLRFADDAVVFVKAGDELKALSGKTINAWGSKPYATAATAGQGALYAKASSGFNNIKTGYLILTGETTVPGVDGDTKYGWITNKPALVKDGDDYYVSISIWNGSDNVNVLVESTKDNSSISSDFDVTKDTNVAKSTPISYKDLGSDHVGTVTSLADTAGTITGYTSGKDDIEFNTGVAHSAVIDKDTVILYVDTANDEGVAGGEIARATETVDGSLVKNAYLAEKGGKVTYIIYDVQNNLAVNEGVNSKTGAKVTTVNDSDKTMTVVNATTVSDLKTELAAWTGTVSVAVFDGTTEVTEGTTALATGNTVRVVAEDGSFITYTVTVASAG